MIVLTAFRDGQPAGRTEAGEGQTLTLGRAPANDLVLDDPALPEEPFTVAFESGSWGVFVREGLSGLSAHGRPVTGWRPLIDGETLEAGEFRLLVRLTEPEAPPPPPRPMAPPSPDPAARPAPASSPDRTEFRPRPTFVGVGPNAAEVMEGPGQGTIRRFEQALLIGRAVRCDLVIDDPTVSREHLRVETHGGAWRAVNLNPNNVTLLGGQAIQTAQVTSGDILTVGPARLRLALTGPAGGPSGPGLASRLLGDKKLLLGAAIGLFVLALALFYLSTPGKSPREAVVEGERAKDRTLLDAEFMRKVSTLLIQARRLADEGQDDQALARLTALLDIDPGNEEAQKLAATIRAKVEAREASARERRERAAKARDTALPATREAERLRAAGDLAGARAALAAALAADPDLPEAKTVLAAIEAAETAARRQAEASAKAEAGEREKLAGLYAEAESGGETYAALVAWRRIAEQDKDPARAAKARKKAADIQDALVKRIMPDFTAGQKLYNQKKYAEAFKVWTKVLEIYPEAKETRAKVNEMTPMLEAEAKRLYEEGLVHEGLGNFDTAKARWRAVIETMPLKDNDSYRKAAAKLGLSVDGGGRP